MSFRSILGVTLATFLTLALGHYCYVKTIGKTLYKGEDQSVGNTIKLEDYLYEEQTDGKGLIVGTSLSVYARHPDLTNLSFSGGTALTVLEILALKENLPSVIFVETNFLYRKADQEVVSNFSSKFREKIPLFHDRYRPMSLILGGIAKGNSDASVVSKVRSKDRIDPEIRRKKIEPQLASAENEIDQETLDKVIGKLLSLVKAIEGRGTKLLFYKTPFDPAIAAQPRHKQWEKALREAFPSHGIQQVVVRNLETSDGIHLCLDGVLEMGKKLGELAESAEQ
ncbi:hypothetical protein N9C66_09225 [Akkermansiaceae bacterium]|nr:hypothetical protein [Akkermansiaceae bacterium]MDB4357881.1 hypothetical protein [bacterium]MDB4382641.1 hypothetical protein [Akkermansiaceae bacterium]MDB4464762.1 hypothetical protein [Akkermansiaceae bacterium]MDB4488550.1 hypothetical protein [Akkermansiaceae bacterium]